MTQHNGTVTLDAAKCFRLSDDRMRELRAEADSERLSVQELLELKVFGHIAPRQRKRKEVHLHGRNPNTPRPAFHFRMSRQQLADLHAEGHELGISVQALLELKVFGQIEPRQRKRRDAKLVNQDALDLFHAAVDQEASSAA